MHGAIVVVGAIVIAVIVLDLLATISVARQIDLPKLPRRSQIIFIWLLPVIGAMITLEIHRRAEPHGAAASGAADAINPAGIGVEESGHSHSDGSH